MVVPRKLQRVKSNGPHARHTSSLFPSCPKYQNPVFFPPRKEIKTGVLRGYCGARPRNNGLFPNSGPSEERHVQGKNTYEALLHPNKRQRNLSEEQLLLGHHESQTRNSPQPPHCILPTYKMNKIQNIPWRTATTLIAPQPPSWPH